MISVFLFLTLLCIIGSGFIHFIRTQMHSYLWLSNSPLHMYHSFFIHPSFDGHPGCCHVLAMWIVLQWTLGCMCLFQFWFPQGICLGLGLLGQMVVLFLVFKGISIPSSIVAISIYISSNSAKGSLFSTPSPAFTVCRLLDDGHSDLCEVISHCSLDLHFSNNERCWASFHVFISHLYVFFGEMSV